MRAMSLRPKNLRRFLALSLGGLLVMACGIAGSHSAAAFGMGGFGHMGGFGGRPMMGGPMAGPRPGGGGLVGRPPGRTGWPSRHPPIVGGGGGGYVGGGGGGPVGPGNSGGNRNNGGGGGGAPSQGNQNFVPNEVITAFAPGTTPQAIGLIARRYELTQLDSQSFPLIGTSLYRWRLGGGRTVANTVRALGSERIVANVQPNYVFTLQEETAKIAAGPQGDAAQYVLAKLQSAEAQQVATGKNILVAVIDFGNRCKTSGSRWCYRQKLRRAGRRRKTAYARHVDCRRHCGTRQAVGYRAGRASFGGACIRRYARRGARQLVCHLQGPAMGGG